MGRSRNKPGVTSGGGLPDVGEDDIPEARGDGYMSPTDDKRGADKYDLDLPPGRNTPQQIQAEDILVARGDYLANVMKGAPGARVFISYDDSKSDLEYCKKLYKALKNGNSWGKDKWDVTDKELEKPQPREVWLDYIWQLENKDSLPEDDEEWNKLVQHQIEYADVFLFVLTKDSIRSEVCDAEIDYAVKLKKRILALTRVDSSKGAANIDIKAVRPVIQLLPGWHCLDDRDDDEANAGLDLLNKAFQKDVEHMRYHSMILRRARYWKEKDFEKSTLLRGRDLRRAKRWLQNCARGNEPQPTDQMMAYIEESKRHSKVIQKRSLIAFYFVFVGVISITFPRWGVFFFALIFSHFFVYFASDVYQ